MSSVVRLSHYRSVARRDLPLGLTGGDSDLVPVALMLWIASLARVILALLHHEAFAAEASFALLCVVALPWFVFNARRRRDILTK